MLGVVEVAERPLHCSKVIALAAVAVLKIFQDVIALAVAVVL
jgi:hypothetical protein